MRENYCDVVVYVNVIVCMNIFQGTGHRFMMNKEVSRGINSVGSHFIYKQVQCIEDTSDQCHCLFL